VVQTERNFAMISLSDSAEIRCSGRARCPFVVGWAGLFSLLLGVVPFVRVATGRREGGTCAAGGVF